MSLNSERQLLFEDTWNNNIPSVPVTIRDHCMVALNSTTVMVIGGWQNGKLIGNSYYYTFGEASWTNGPRLRYNRNVHSCGRIKRDEATQEMTIIVAGGYDGSYFLSSVEILDEASSAWQTGTGLPLGIGHAPMIEDPNGGVILIAGASTSSYQLDSLYQLLHGGQGAVWTLMSQQLKTKRQTPTAILVPDSVVVCS